MPKDPAFLFYNQDWLSGTYFLIRKQKGAYIDLLCYQADKDILTLEIIKEVLNSDFDECWPKIKDKFIEENGVFFNRRLREEKEKRNKYSESRRMNRKNICKSYDEHMENENINEDINILKNKEAAFKNEVLTFNKYPASTLNDFILYWTEPNKSKTRLRYELEKTWDTSRRLAKWAANESKFSKVQNKERPVQTSKNWNRIINDDWDKKQPQSLADIIIKKTTT